MVGFIARTAAITWKDALIEVRGREMVSSVLIFALLVLVVFSFAFNPVKNDLTDVFPGVLWVAFFFAGTLGLQRAFAGEKAEDALSGLALVPGDRGALFFGKFLGILLFMIMFELLLTPAFFALLNVPMRGGLGLVAVILVGTIGFAALGTWLGAVTVYSRAGEVLLPILLFPLLVPVIIGAVRATEGMMTGDPATAWFWFKMLAAYDMIFLALPFVLFEYIFES